MLKIKVFKKNFAVLLLCSFCLLLSLSLNVCITEAACGNGVIEGAEECDGVLFLGGATTCEDIGDIGNTSMLRCINCTRDDSMCNGGFQSPPRPGNVPDNFRTTIKNITNWLLGFITMIAVLAMVWGGINYLTSAGDEDKAKTGKKTIQYALTGLIVAGIAYAIVSVVVSTILE